LAYGADEVGKAAKSCNYNAKYFCIFCDPKNRPICAGTTA
jgi:hypothetical protein